MAQADALAAELFRREAGGLTAWLARRLGPGRLDLIEDALQDAFRAALATWPERGVPDRPAAWLAVVARNKALDRLRRDAREAPFDEAAAWRLGFANPDETGRLDDTLALMFVACHPDLGQDEQTMLTLQAVCGFSANDIARAYLSRPATVAQRLVRAKRKLKTLKPGFSIPDDNELTDRLPALVSAIYLLFNGGYTSREGATLIEPELCAEALRLAELLTQHPRTATAEAHALAALIAFHHARRAARTDADGGLILLQDQDRSLWDRELIARGFAHLKAARRAETPAALHLEAAIAATHASAPDFAATDWPALAHFYEVLAGMKPTPVVRLNAAIAVAFAGSAEGGLARLDALAEAPRLADYAPYHAARGHLLRQLGRHQDAGAAYAAALACPVNDAERAYLERRRAAC